MKPVIVGMNNPYSNDPRYALYPHPQGSAGHRLYSMLLEAGLRLGMGVSPLDYVDHFDRINLVNDEEWSPKEAAESAGRLLPTLKNKTVVLCGKSVAKAMGFKKAEFSLAPQTSSWDFTYFVIPHPSGLCREYNDQKNRERVGDLLLKLYVGADV